MGITIERLPPERSSTMPVAAAAGGCCSSCCCCFHTVGSLIGAALARAPKVTPSDTPVAVIAGAPTEPKYSATKEYWLSFLIGSVILMMILGVYLDGNDRAAGMAIFYAILIPAVQLGASIIALVMILVSKRPGQGERLGHLGRITLYAFVGALIGLVLVFAMFSK
jgi:hypothetical protein